jgi:hypothetical protein
MKMIDLGDFRERAEAMGDFDYVEAEGPTTLRFDLAGDSAWVQSSGRIEGPKFITRILESAIKGM